MRRPVDPFLRRGLHQPRAYSGRLDSRVVGDNPIRCPRASRRLPAAVAGLPRRRWRVALAVLAAAAAAVAVLLAIGSGDGRRRKADLARATSGVPSATPGAGAVHDRGQRRPPDPHGRLGAGAGARRRRLRLRPPVQGDQALRRGRRPGALPRRDADDPGAADELPDLQHPSGAGAGIKATGWDACDTASNHSLDQAQTGIDATGKALDHAGIEHTGSFPSAAAQRKPVIVRRPRGEGRLPRLHHGHERDPRRPIRGR